MPGNSSKCWTRHTNYYLFFLYLGKYNAFHDWSLYRVSKSRKQTPFPIKFGKNFRSTFLLLSDDFWKDACNGSTTYTCTTEGYTCSQSCSLFFEPCLIDQDGELPVSSTLLSKNAGHFTPWISFNLSRAFPSATRSWFRYKFFFFSYPDTWRMLHAARSCNLREQMWVFLVFFCSLLSIAP